jgi:hypothetical protein
MTGSQLNLPQQPGPMLPRQTSLAQLLHEYSQRWEVERVDRGTEWVAVLRETSGNYMRIVGARDLDALRYKMDQVERDEPEEREANPTR